MRVVVTGGAGYVGYDVVSRLARDPDVSEVVVYDNCSRGNYALLAAPACRTGRVRLVRRDVLDSRGLRECLETGAVILHLAAIVRSPFDDEFPHIFDQINHWGTAEVCYAAESAGFSRLVYVSSAAVYGSWEDEVSAETTNPRPVTSYGESKLAAERQVLRLQSQGEVHVVRAGSVFGFNPAARFDTVANKLCLKTVLGEPLQVNGSGKQLRPFISARRLTGLLADMVTGRSRPARQVSDAVQLNASINDLVAAIQEHAPSAEFIHVNRAQRLRNLAVMPSCDPETDNAWRTLVQDVGELIGALGGPPGVLSDPSEPSSRGD